MFHCIRHYKGRDESSDVHSGALLHRPLALWHPADTPALSWHLLLAMKGMCFNWIIASCNPHSPPFWLLFKCELFKKVRGTPVYRPVPPSKPPLPSFKKKYALWNTCLAPPAPMNRDIRGSWLVGGCKVMPKICKKPCRVMPRINGLRPLASMCPYYTFVTFLAFLSASN